MNKNAIKKYAVWARNELIARVSFKAEQMGITEKGITEEGSDSVNGVLLTNEQKTQRNILIGRVKEKGYKVVIEETAYTWFNRFIALRYMEANSLLPSMVRVFTDDSNNFKPQILDEAIHLDFDGLDKEKIFELKDKSDDEELYKYLLIAQCNALSNELPKMFSKLENYTELLFPDNLLREGSVVEQMVTTIPEEDWQDQVQIIGWMYQYWNIEPKETAMKGKSYKKEDFAAVTQLFTPDWIVRYMVENSLGRVWKETHKDFDTSVWKYYLEESPENAGKVAATLENTDLEELTFLDPCMGSGHILVYAFDVFMNLYASRGVGKRDAVRNIITKNLFGIDLDKRAWQLSYFALKMKACQYDANFLSRGIEPNVYYMQDFKLPEGANLTGELKIFAEQFKFADVYGSLTPAKKAYESVVKQIEEYKEELFSSGTKAILERMVETAKVLDRKYSVVVTNPPYMNPGANDILKTFVANIYPDSKTDLFAVFMEYAAHKTNGLYAMINMHSWMFLSSYEKLRIKLHEESTINMLHLGTRAFDEIAGEVVSTTAFVNTVLKLEQYKGKYIRLVNYAGEANKEKEFFNSKNTYIANENYFSKIPGSPIAYWASETILKAFENKALGDLSISRNGMKTGDNERFLRLWFEVKLNDLNLNIKSYSDSLNSKTKWFPYNKGGEYRRWYGNNDYIVNWQDQGYEIFECAKKDKRNVQDYPDELKFSPSGSWSLIATGKPAFRYKEYNLSDIAGMSFYSDKETVLYLLGFCNSPISTSILSILAPTINFQAGDIGRLPIIITDNSKEKVLPLVQENIILSKTDWDSFETSWDFERHPLMPDSVFNSKTRDETKPQMDGEYRGHNLKIADLFDWWKNDCDTRFAKLKANEEELNRIFIDIYGLQDELTPDVKDEDVTVRKADLKRDIKSFISYAVGCMLGRYSISVDGLVFAGGDTIVTSSYEPFGVDDDNIIPICDKAYFDDDVVGRFAKFVELVYGKETLDENLQFIADALGGAGKEPMGVIRNYFLNDFYKEHCKMYQNKPIYWLFDAGKKNSFKALIYMHRYNKDTIGDIRTKYVHPHQTRLNSIIDDLEKRSSSASGSAKIKIEKELAEVKDQKTELFAFEEKVHHFADQRLEIDLDDGVKHNYEIFEDVLAKSK